MVQIVTKKIQLFEGHACTIQFRCNRTASQCWFVTQIHFEFCMESKFLCSNYVNSWMVWIEWNFPIECRNSPCGLWWFTAIALHAIPHICLRPQQKRLHDAWNSATQLLMLNATFQLTSGRMLSFIRPVIPAEKCAFNMSFVDFIHSHGKHRRSSSLNWCIGYRWTH